MIRIALAAALLLPLLTADPTAAQSARRAAVAAKPPSDPTALQAWCRRQIFQRYAVPMPGDPSRRILPMEQSVAMTDGCVRSKGKTF